MAGTFTCEAQANRDPENYFHIRLVMIPIWQDQGDSLWMYVEQAASSSLDRPYRQRVYELRFVRTVGSGTDVAELLESIVYELPGDSLRFAGAWRDPTLFNSITPDDLVMREGCTVLLSCGQDMNRFTGSTQGRGCQSSLGGAAYATSEAVITTNLLTSWDRGFDAEGNQVWGATDGPYEFVKVLARPPE